MDHSHAPPSGLLRTARSVSWFKWLDFLVRRHSSNLNDISARFSVEIAFPTRWSTTLSSKVDLHHAINVRVLCGASLVTRHPRIWGKKATTLVLHRAGSAKTFFGFSKVANAWTKYGGNHARFTLSLDLRWRLFRILQSGVARGNQAGTAVERSWNK